MTRYVIDACVAVKWFVIEEYSDQAKLLSTPANDLIAPDLLPSEVGSALLKKLRRGEVLQADALGAFSRLPLAIDLRSSLGLLSPALTIAAIHSRSFYDALYVALALLEHCQLVTADERLYNALRSSFPDTMHWLGA